MAEDQFQTERAIASTRFRTNRAPGFRGGATNPKTGNLVPSTFRGRSTQQNDVQSDSLEGAKVANTAKPKTSSIGQITADNTPRPIRASARGSSKPTKNININLGGGGGLPGLDSIGSSSGLNPISNISANVGTAITYGTNIGSQQTAQLAAQDAGFGSVGIGGTVGTGLASGLATLVQTGDVGAAVETGVATAVGRAIGTAIGGPVGGFIGGAIGGLFCFAKGTLVLMADMTRRPIEDLQIGDEVAFGGMVTGVGTALTTELFEYKDTRVTGAHAVFEDGRWLRVRDSVLAKPVKVDEYELIIPVATATHLIAGGDFVSADMVEINNGDQVNDEQRIVVMNLMHGQLQAAKKAEATLVALKHLDEGTDVAA